MAYGTVKVDAIQSSTQTVNVDDLAKLASPDLTGNPTAPTQAADDSSTKIATTAYVQTELTDYAPLASPTLTGTPTAPTAAADTNTTQVATTAYVQTELSDYATLASPALTGSPTAPTQSANDSSTKLATTAFVMTELGDYATTASPAFTTDIELSAQAPLKFMDADSSNYVAFKGPATVSANVEWTLPATDGAANTMLTTDGAGVLSWTAPSGGASLGLAIALG